MNEEGLKIITESWWRTTQADGKDFVSDKEMQNIITRLKQFFLTSSCRNDWVKELRALLCLPVKFGDSECKLNGFQIYGYSDIIADKIIEHYGDKNAKV